MIADTVDGFMDVVKGDLFVLVACTTNLSVEPR